MALSTEPKASLMLSQCSVVGAVPSLESHFSKISSTYMTQVLHAFTLQGCSRVLSQVNNAVVTAGQWVSLLGVD